MSESAQITVSCGAGGAISPRSIPLSFPLGQCWSAALKRANAYSNCTQQLTKQGKRIRDKVRVEPAIMAYDQDTGINARLRYSIILGNEGGFFEMNAQTGELFLIREIDLEKLTNPTLSLQIQASQVDNPFRQALARVDISVQDINDNSPEVSLSLFLALSIVRGPPPAKSWPACNEATVWGSSSSSSRCLASALAPFRGLTGGISERLAFRCSFRWWVYFKRFTRLPA